MGKRQLGVVLTPAEVQDEGLDRVLDNIVGAGATAISPTLGVYAPARSGEGSREPPLDVSGSARLLDRPLWGQRELWMRGYTPHPPDPATNHVDLYRFLLTRNHDLYGARFSIGPDGDLYLVGRVALEHLTEVELDRIIGVLYQATEQWFQPVVHLAFRRNEVSEKG